MHFSVSIIFMHDGILSNPSEKLPNIMTRVPVWLSSGKVRGEGLPENMDAPPPLPMCLHLLGLWACDDPYMKEATVKFSQYSYMACIVVYILAAHTVDHRN